MPHTPLRSPDLQSLSSTLASLLKFPPHDGQIEAIRSLVFDQQDLIVIAPTGWGKSAIFQAIPVLRGGICLMIMPLNLLEEGQVKSIARIPNCRPCILNGQSNGDALLDKIRSGEYTHVLLSPEIALSERFKAKVLYDQEFQDHLVLVAIDELHVVSEWGQHWRNSYSRLALLRDRIGKSVPWLGCSATLDPITLAEVRDLCGFDPSVRIQRTSIDRSDIKFELRQFQNPVNSYRDLEFLIKPVEEAVEQVIKERRENMARDAFKDDGIVAARAALTSTRHQRKEAGSDSRACCKRIPKTVVYVDSIKQIRKMVKVLQAFLIRAGCSKTSAINAVQAYHSELAEYDKRRISTEFEKPDTENVLDSSVHRIIVATDAMGMGIDNPDIRLVIQWGVPPSMGALLQRAGRTARGKGVSGKFIWLVPAWCFGDRIENLPPRSVKKRMTERERRSVLPRGIWELINHSTCIRRGILEFFGEDCTSYICPVEADLCCSRCAGEKVRVRTSRAGRPVKLVQSQKHITDAVKLALVEWREAKAAAVLSPRIFTAALAEMILPDKAVGIISRAAATINSINSLAHAVSEEWGDLASYGKEVLDVTQDACLRAALEKQKLSEKREHSKSGRGRSTAGQRKAAGSPHARRGATAATKRTGRAPEVGKA